MNMFIQPSLTLPRPGDDIERRAKRSVACIFKLQICVHSAPHPGFGKSLCFSFIPVVFDVLLHSSEGD